MTVDLLLRSGAIPEPTFLWWDIRPQPRLGTVEIRIMDAQPRLATTAALTALVQVLARLELEQGYAPGALVDAGEALAENRFIAARDAAAGELIDPVQGIRVPVARMDALEELEDARTLVLAPEPERQERLMASAGLPVLVADLVARFAA